MRSEWRDGSGDSSETLALLERYTTALGSASPTNEEPTTASQISWWSRWLSGFQPSAWKSSSPRRMMLSSNWHYMSQSLWRFLKGRWLESRSSGISGDRPKIPRSSSILPSRPSKGRASDPLSGIGRTAPDGPPKEPHR